MSLDANGWTVITPKPDSSFTTWLAQQGSGYTGNGTRFIYVSLAGRSIASGALGTFLDPVLNPEDAATLLRNGSPDWLLMRKGDVWTNHAPGGIAKSGQDVNNPMVISSYDPNATQNPPLPDPYTGGNRPEFDLTATWYSVQSVALGSTSGGTGNFMAFLGLKCYASSRDPAGSFVLADAKAAPAGLFSNTTGSFLVEDCWLGFFDEAINISGSTAYGVVINGLTFRRNQLVSSYAGSSAGTGTGLNIFTAVSGGPSSFVATENLIDHNGWNTDSPITWAPPSGFSHNLYFAGQQVNGDAASESSPVTFTGNVLANEGSAPAFRVAGIITNNLIVQCPRTIPFQQPNAYTSNISDNVMIQGSITSQAGTTGIELISRYINENIVVGGANVTNNIMANSPINPAGIGIIFDAANGAGGHDNNSGCNGNSVTGNIVYNWGANNPTQDLIAPVAGGFYAGTVTVNGSGYTDLSASISSAAASTDGQNYIDVTTGAASPVIHPIGSVMYKVGSGAVQGINQSQFLGGATFTLSAPATISNGAGYSDGTQLYTVTPAISGSTTLVTLCGTLPTANSGTLTKSFGAGGDPATVTYTAVTGVTRIYGTNFSAAPPAGNSGATFTGTLYYPYYQTVLTTVTGGGSGCECDLVSVGGQIVAFFQFGSDTPTQEFDDSPGHGYQPLDLMTSTVSGGSGFRLRVDAICSNATSPNTLDPTGTNSAGFPDPNRTCGSYYAAKIVGSTANATFTGSVASGVLTISGISGTVSLGDAIVWSFQSKQDYIKSFGTVSVVTVTFTLNVTANITSGATYSDGTLTYTVSSTLTAGIRLVTTTNGVPATNSGTLTLQTGTGDSPVTYIMMSYTGGNGTYNLAGTQTVASQSMSSYTAGQLITAMRGQTKSTWSTLLTADAVNDYIQEGFGIFETATIVNPPPGQRHGNRGHIHWPGDWVTAR